MLFEAVPKLQFLERAHFLLLNAPQAALFAAKNRAIRSNLLLRKRISASIPCAGEAPPIGGTRLPGH
jgi:hypothetical protein